MAVVKIEGGVVVQRWKDVDRLDDFRAKYPDETGNIAEADAVPSSIHRGGKVFERPIPSPRKPKPQPDINAAIQALIDGDTVAAQAAMDEET